MSRHLTTSHIESALSRSKSVEQFLGSTQDGCISWLEIRPSDSGIQLWRFDVLDGGSEDFLDLYSFSPAEGDWPEDPVSVHDSAADALLAAQTVHSANPDRWVNEGVIQDEYRDYLATKR